MVFNYSHSFIVALILAVTVQSKAFNNTVYIISNAETPSLDLPGLTPIGAQRAHECLPALFAPLDIGLVVTCPFDPESGKCGATVVTATPIAQSLGLSVDTSCGADEETDDDCVPNLLKNFAKTSTDAILVVWDLSDLDSLFENLDVDDDDDDDTGDDDDDDDNDTPHYDILTTVFKNKVESTVSQGCSGIDGQAPGTYRRNYHGRALKKRTIVSRITVGRYA